MAQTRIALVLAAALCAPAGVAQERTFETLRTPDGTRFLLVPDASADAVPVVHWAIVTPVGIAEDAPGREGLARAVARASLNGTARYGSADSVRESAALRSLDRIARRAADAVERGAEIPDELVSELAAAAETARELGDPNAWREAVRGAPGHIEIDESAESLVLRVTTFAPSLPRVALLLLDRRENPMLRNVQNEFRAVRAELARAQEGPSATVRREILGLAFVGAAAARSVTPETPHVPRDEAFEVHRAIQHPSRSYHVLTGGFDPNEVRSLLQQVFARSSLDSVPMPPPASPSEGRERVATIPTDGAEAYAVAVPVPRGTDPRLLAVLAHLLDDGARALVPSVLAQSARRYVVVDATVPFPPDRRPGLLLLEAREVGLPADPSADLPALRGLVLDALATIDADTPSDDAIARAARQVVAQIEIARASPGRLAFDLAKWCGVFELEPEVALSPFSVSDPAAVRDLARRMLVEGPRVEVSLERSR